MMPILKNVIDNIKLLNKYDTDYIDTLNFIVNLMLESEKDLKTATLIREFNHDRLDIKIIYNKYLNQGQL